MSRGKHAPAKSGGFPTPVRRARAEATHRAEIEGGSERMRRADFPWDMIGLMAVIGLVVFAPGVWAGWRIGTDLGWW